MYHQCKHPYTLKIINSLLFMMSLSKEHPMFIEKMASNDNVLLGIEGIHTLNKFSVRFHALEEHLIHLEARCSLIEKNNPLFLEELLGTLQNIIRTNIEFINCLSRLKYHFPNKIWTLLLNHITHEHKQILQKCTEFSVYLRALS